VVALAKQANTAIVDATSAGCCGPVRSAVEDIFVFLASILSIISIFIAGFVVLGLLSLTCFCFYRLRRWRQRRREKKAVKAAAAAKSAAQMPAYYDDSESDDAEDGCCPRVRLTRSCAVEVDSDDDYDDYDDDWE